MVRQRWFDLGGGSDARLGWVALLLACAVGRLIAVPSPAPSQLTVAFSSDTEGHVAPCQGCASHPGLGGLARRATVVDTLRRGGPILLLDAGNALIGGDSLLSGGKVIVAAYDEMGYDAVNLCHRDFRQGKRKTLAALAGCRWAPLSANILDGAGGKPLVRPYIVKEMAGRRIAVVGVAEPPEGLAFLPHLRQQLEGIDFEPVSQSLRQWLPRVHAQADTVVLLYHGSERGLLAVREEFGTRLSLILVSGMRAEDVSGLAGATVATGEHGKHLGVVNLGAGALESRQIAIEPTLPPAAAMERALAAYLSEGR